MNTGRLSAVSRASKTNLGRVLSIASGLLLVASQPTFAEDLRTVNNQIKGELGCPVEVISAKTVLEIDPIGTPMACRIYLDFKNTSAKTITGLKFRIGYVDSEDQVRGSFHAPDGHMLEPGASSNNKWKGEKVDPRTTSVVIRPLVARFSDGSMWESEKLKEMAPGTGGDPSSATGNNGGASGAASSIGSTSGGGSGAAQTPGSTDAQGSPAAPPAGSDKSTDGY